ncbi:c-type cytochrome [Spartinivicinus poritis]|uniref:Cytochrome c n=1 Tax=Spartinivicinus poritis TaxID=2994640 RepID=A0ABT5U941_9GAMM|nr:cytochrome c [Spartinivicinus sp. A2-2]MDE1461654.1 cytochrome c [Spartinivicinus sp. A2-2]
MNKLYYIAFMLTIFTTSQSALAEDFANIISQRQQSFKAIEIFFDNFEEPDSDIEWQIINKESAKLAKATQQLPNLFPIGSDKNSKSKEKIWDNKQDFNIRLDKLNSAFNNIQQATQEKNQQLLIENYKLAKSSCNSCHRKYRSLW